MCKSVLLEEYGQNWRKNMKKHSGGEVAWNKICRFYIDGSKSRCDDCYSLHWISVSEEARGSSDETIHCRLKFEKSCNLIKQHLWPQKFWLFLFKWSWRPKNIFKRRTLISGKFIFATTCIHRSSTYCNDFPPYFLAQCVAVVSRYVQKCTHTIALSDVVTSTYIPTSSYL